MQLTKEVPLQDQRPICTVPKIWNIFPEIKLCGLVPNFYVHVSVQGFIPGKMRTHGTPSKATIINKTRPAGSFFPPASQADRRAGPVFCTISFLWVLHGLHSPKTELYTASSSMQLTLPGVQPGAARCRSSHSPPPPPPSIPVKNNGKLQNIYMNYFDYFWNP